MTGQDAKNPLPKDGSGSFEIVDYRQLPMRPSAEPSFERVKLKV